MDTRIGQINVTYSTRGIPSYTLELWHDGLKKHRLIKDARRDVLCRKAELQVAEWQDRWLTVDSRHQELSEKNSEKLKQQTNKIIAAEKTQEAQKELDELSDLLETSLRIDCSVDWEQLKDRSEFPEPYPASPKLPPPPPAPVYPRQPQATDKIYVPVFGILDKIINSRKKRRIAEKQKILHFDYEQWSQQIQTVEISYTAAVNRQEREIARLQHEYAIAIDIWNERKKAFHDEQHKRHAAIDNWRVLYLNKTPDGVAEYCDFVLSRSSYPSYFPQKFRFEFEPEAGLLIIDYSLPAPTDIPTLKAIKYIATRDEFEEQHLSDLAFTKLYDDVLYQVILRTLHELFEADTISGLHTIVFNGIVTSVDRGNGKSVTACVLSLRANRNEFLAINLALVEPKICFKSLKGVGSSKLHSLSPVAPIMTLNREDSRFVAGYEVADTLDQSVNLAAMDWEDFEHLIRELFEKEFLSTGGEVKVTQASRDGGVDAVAFDPDPIRGGKIIIQAKRYTNTIGVSAVRDLYGAVLNEGATKGILVTTADYGPDSYSFANGKPLTLLNGANLLHLLEKHGHRARINIKEAKKFIIKS